MEMKDVYIDWDGKNPALETAIPSPRMNFKDKLA